MNLLDNYLELVIGVGVSIDIVVIETDIRRCFIKFKEIIWIQVS